MKRWLKTFLIPLAIFLLPTLWLMVSHFHAKRTVEHYKAQLRAAGEKLTVDELLPPRVPPENNGAKFFLQAIPYLDFKGAIYTNRMPAMMMVAPGKAMIGFEQSELISIRGNLGMTNGWDDVEQELKQRASGLGLLRQAAACPGLDFGLDYHRGNLVGVTYPMKMRNAALLLSAASAFDLHRGQTPSSITNLHALLTLLAEWKDEPVVTSQFIRIASADIASRAQWELLQATNLTDPDLALLQRDWESMEFVRSTERALEMDRVWEIALISNLRTSNSPSGTLGAGSFSFSTFATRRSLPNVLKYFRDAASRKTSDALWRTSWSYGDELRVLRAYDAIIGAARQVQTNGSFKDALAERDRKIGALGFQGKSDNWLRNRLGDDVWFYFSYISGISGGSTGNTIERTLAIEATRRIVITAIALKRYQLRHGTWPANLNALSPEFLLELQHDPVDGQPLRYRANPDGTFTLYSVGSDDTDDGGDASVASPRRSVPANLVSWQNGRDWVWPQPATPEEVRDFYNLLQRPIAHSNR